MRHTSLAAAAATATVVAVAVVVAVGSSVAAAAQGTAQATGRPPSVEMLDDCDPTDPGWLPTGGCLLRDGDVTVEEFFAFLRSPLATIGTPFLVGHPSWLR